jgi:transcriptional regulator with XRE-family HTH domain
VSKNILEVEENIKNKLREAIQTSGLTLTEIAQRVGISVATISYYKNKGKLPTLPTFSILCNVLDISADEILGLKSY